ncbi:MAG: glycosyltransferase [Anaerolineae bacterium]
MGVVEQTMTGPIALVCGSWPPIKCGIGDFSHRLALELAQQGHSIVVITDRGAATDAPAGIQVWPLIGSWTPAALLRVLDALRRAHPCVVNLHYPTQQYGRFSLIDLLPTAIRLSLKLPVVTTIHEFTTYHRLGRWRVRNLVQSSTAAIIPDPVNRAALAAFAPAAAARLHAIPLGPAIEPHLPDGFDRGAWRAAQGLAADTFVLAYFGFISPSKGIDTLMDALEQLPPDGRLHLWLIADREPSSRAYAAFHHAIAARLARSGRAADITWTGYLPAAELSRYLAAADLAVLPYADGASLRRTTLLTALAHGLPVLSTGEQPPCPGVQVVPIGDAGALARAIVRLGQDATARADLAAGAQQMAATMSWPAIAAQTAALLDSYCR